MNTTTTASSSRRPTALHSSRPDERIESPYRERGCQAMAYRGVHATMRELTASEAAIAVHRLVNRAPVGYPRDSSVPALFAASAQRRPAAPAVVQGDRTLTYHQLERLANGLPGDLLARGVQPGSTVGVCLARSPELIVALLGAL